MVDSSSAFGAEAEPSVRAINHNTPGGHQFLECIQLVGELEVKGHHPAQSSSWETPPGSLDHTGSEWERAQVSLKGICLEIGDAGSWTIEIASLPQRCNSEEYGECFSVIDGQQGMPVWFRVESVDALGVWMKAVERNWVFTEAAVTLRDIDETGEFPTFECVDGISLSGDSLIRVPCTCDAKPGMLVISVTKLSFEASDNPTVEVHSTDVRSLLSSEMYWRGMQGFAEQSGSESTVCELRMREVSSNEHWSCWFDWPAHAHIAASVLHTALSASASGDTCNNMPASRPPRQAANGSNWRTTCTASFCHTESEVGSPALQTMGEVSVLAHRVSFSSSLANLDGTPGPTSALIPLDELQGMEKCADQGVLLYHPAGVSARLTLIWIHCCIQICKLNFSTEEQATQFLRAVNESLAVLLPLLARLGSAGHRSVKLMGAGRQTCPLQCSSVLQKAIEEGVLTQKQNLYRHEASGVVCDRFLFIVPPEMHLRASHFWDWYDTTADQRTKDCQAIAGQCGAGIVCDHRIRRIAWRGLPPTIRPGAWRACSEHVSGGLAGSLPLLQRIDHYQQLLRTHPAGSQARVTPAQFQRGSGCESPKLRSEWRKGAGMVEQVAATLADRHPLARDALLRVQKKMNHAAAMGLFKESEWRAVGHDMQEAIRFCVSEGEVAVAAELQAMIFACEPKGEPWQQGSQRFHPAAVCAAPQAQLELQLDQDLPRTLRDSLLVKRSGGEKAADAAPSLLHGEEHICSQTRRILLAYTRGGLGGYLQGLNEVAARMLVMIPEEHEAFFLFRAAYDHLLRGIISGLESQPGLVALRGFLKGLLSRVFPDLVVGHLCRQGPEGLEDPPPVTTALDLLLDQHVTALVITLFTGVPIETQMRLWDVFFCVGAHTIFGAVLVLFARLKKLLMEASGFVEILEIFARALEQLYDAEQFMIEVEEMCQSARLEDLWCSSFLPMLQTSLGVALSEAIMARNSSEVRLLVQLGASVSATPSLQELPLILATQTANVEAVEMLLEARANVDARGAFMGQAAIHAVFNAPEGSEQESTCMALLRLQPNLLISDLRGRTALHLSVLASNMPLCDRFLEAARHSLIDTADILEARCIGAIAATAVHKSVTCYIVGGWTALHYAVATKDENPMVQLLLNSMCNPNSTGACDWTPLHLAISSGNSQAALALLDAKAYPDAQTSSGLTPLHVAANGIQYEMCVLLLCAGASQDVLTQDGCTPYSYAERHPCPTSSVSHLLQILYKVHTDVSDQDSQCDVMCFELRDPDKRAQFQQFLERTQPEKIRLLQLEQDAEKLLMEHRKMGSAELAQASTSPNNRNRGLAKHFVTTYLLEKSANSITRFGMLPTHLDLNRNGALSIQGLVILRQEALHRLAAPFVAFKQLCPCPTSPTSPTQKYNDILQGMLQKHEDQE